MKTKLKAGLASTVLKRLNDKVPPKRTKRTLVLTECDYIEFEKLCRKENRYPSEVVDEFIRLFVSEQKG